MSEKSIKNCINGKSFTEIFAMNFDNVLTVFMMLMQNGMQFTASTSFIDPDEKYIREGIYNYGAEDMHILKLVHICAAGSIEKVLVAGLQIMYAVGFAEEEATGDDYSLFSCCNDQFCEIHLMFKFNGQDCQLKMVQSAGSMTAALFVED